MSALVQSCFMAARRLHFTDCPLKTPESLLETVLADPRQETENGNIQLIQLFSPFLPFLLDLFLSDSPPSPSPPPSLSLTFSSMYQVSEGKTR